MHVMTIRGAVSAEIADGPAGFRFSLANTLRNVGYYKAMVKDGKAPRHVAGAIKALYREVNDQVHGDCMGRIRSAS